MSEKQYTDRTGMNNEAGDLPFEYVTNNPPEAHSAQQAFGRLQERIGQYNRSEQVQRQLRLWKYGAVAAGIALLISCCWIFILQQPDPDMKLLCTEAGSPQQFTLPDGTRVWVNADSRLLYPEKFDRSKREIYISGEAYFEVARNERSPFIVKTDKLNIRVLGTKFNVKSYPDEPNIETTLVEGSVSVEKTDVKQETLLRPNQQLVLRKADGKLALYDNINMKHYTGWVEGRLYFRQASIEEIAKKLERSFNVKIHVESEKLRERKFTGRFDRQETLEDILNAIKLTTPYQYTRQGNIIVMRD